jgi:hypothetical protein
VIASVDWGALWQAVWTAAVAGVAIVVVFAVAVLGTHHFQDARRSDNHIAAGAYGLLALLGGAATLAAVVFAITVITTK